MLSRVKSIITHVKNYILGIMPEMSLRKKTALDVASKDLSKQKPKKRRKKNA